MKGALRVVHALLYSERPAALWASVKSSHYGHSPAKYRHISGKHKKLLKERQLEIHRENQTLISKLAKVPRERELSLMRPLRKESLNAQQRKRQLRNITAANRQFRKRLTGLSASINANHLQEEAKLQEKRSKSISRYPLCKHSRTPDRRQFFERGLMFRESCTVNQKTFMVEIEESAESLFLSMKGTDGTLAHQLRLPLHRARELMQTDYDYGKLLSRIQLKDNEISI